MRYEQMREQILNGGNPRRVGLSVVLRQGLWAWMMLVAPEDTDGGAHRSHVRSAACPPALTATVCGDLLSAWTDLVVGTIGRQEAS